MVLRSRDFPERVVDQLRQQLYYAGGGCQCLRGNWGKGKHNLYLYAGKLF